MQLPIEELQYRSISMWKDYNDRITIKKNEIKQKKDFDKMYRAAESILKKTRDIRLS